MSFDFVPLGLAVIAAACASVQAEPSSGALQPVASWAKPIDSAKLSAAALGSKALSCLDRGDALKQVRPRLPLDVRAAIFEARAARTPKEAADALSSVLFDGSADAARRIFVRARKDSDVAEYDPLFASKPLPKPLPKYLPFPLSLDNLVNVGRIDDARQVYADAEARGGLASADTAVFVLGAIGRADAAYALIRPEGPGRRIVLESELIDGILRSAAPARALDLAVAALVHDVRDHSDDDTLQLGFVASKIRIAGYGDHARPLRAYLFKVIKRDRTYAMLQVGLAPEVLAAGDPAELADLDKLIAELVPGGRNATLAWERAYYRGDFAAALALTRTDSDPEDRQGHLYRMWARAACEGFDPAALRAIDELACRR